MRILRGTSVGIFGESYMDRFQKVAETESSLKVQRLARDIPKFLRGQYEWQESLKAQEKEAEKRKEEGTEGEGFQRQTVEANMQDKQKSNYENKINHFGALVPEDYQPVLYQVVKNKQQAFKKENLQDIHDGFLERTDRLLQVFHQRAHIHDGLKNLTDKEIILKVRESPTKLKKATV